jgi:hypothetical protein
MQSCDTRTTTQVASDGHGPACMVVCNQAAGDPGGWSVDLYCLVPGALAMRAFVRRIQITAPTATNPPTRILEVVTLPGVQRWSAEVVPPTPAPARPIEIGLFAGDGTGQGPANVAP